MQELEPILLNTELLTNRERLQHFLERLYLSQGRFEIHFEKAYLSSIEQAFDHIIFKHGLLKSDILFKFQLEPDA